MDLTDDCRHGKQVRDQWAVVLGRITVHQNQSVKDIGRGLALLPEKIHRTVRNAAGDEAAELAGNRVKEATLQFVEKIHKLLPPRK